jgi:hypothetical protein
MHYNTRTHEILRAIQPFKGAMIPYGVLNDLTREADRDVYFTLIEGVTVEVVDHDGRRVGIVGGEIEDGGCKRAFPIYPRDLITPAPSYCWEYDEDDIVKGIERLVNFGRICVRPQDGGYILGVFNCAKLES